MPLLLQINLLNIDSICQQYFPKQCPCLFCWAAVWPAVAAVVVTLTEFCTYYC